MRKTAMLLTLALFTFASLSRAGTLANVTVPDTVQVGSTTLVLNGMGLRTKYAFKVYVAALYLVQKSSDPSIILKADTPKRVVMHFVRDVSKNQLTDGFTESFENNTPEAAKTLKPDIDRFFSALDAVKDGEELTFTYIPGTGTSIAIANKEKLTLPGSAFAEMLFSVWLGPKPPNAALKKGILGQ
jgi:ATP-dependent 26S proteasome regulatory subunit